MTEPIRTLTISLNNEFSAHDQITQFQESCFAFKTLLVAAGWTVTQSFDGTTLDATDNWATAADVTFGTINNGAWVILQSPAGWLTNSEQLELLFYVAEDLALNDAQIAPIKIAPKGYNSDGVASVAANDGSLTTIAASLLAAGVDTDTFILDDGPNVAVTFIYDDDGSVVETATTRAIDHTGAETADVMRDRTITAINNAPLLNTVASNGGAATVSLVQRVQGTVGNTTITETVANAGFLKTNFTNGVNGTLPTSDGIETTVLASGDDMLPWNAPAIGRYSTWRSSRGDIMFGVKRQGEQFFTQFIMLFSNEDDNGGGAGDHRWGYFARSSINTNVLLSTQLVSTSNWRGATPAGTAAVTTASAQATPWSWSSAWQSGINQEGGTHDVPIDVGHNNSFGISPRYLGQIVDVYATPVNLPFGALDDPERSQTQRRVSMGSGVWVFAPTASLPFQ